MIEQIDELQLKSQGNLGCQTEIIPSSVSGSEKIVFRTRLLTWKGKSPGCAASAPFEFRDLLRSLFFCQPAFRLFFTADLVYKPRLQCLSSR